MASRIWGREHISIFKNLSSDESAGVHVFNHETEKTLQSSKAENPVEIAFAWHIHSLSNGISTLRHCTNMMNLASRLHAKKVMAFSDASPVSLFGKALLDSRNGRCRLSNGLLPNCFNNMVVESWPGDKDARER